MYLSSIPQVFDSGHELCDANINDVNVFKDPYAPHDSWKASCHLGIGNIGGSGVVDRLLDVTNDVVWTPPCQVVYVVRDA